MKLRLQDILFGILALALLVLAAFDIKIAVLALLGAFLCGAIYVFAGMLPAGSQSFLERAFTSVFLAVVLSSLVLILPGTMGTPPPEMQATILAIAGTIPLAALGFEIVRTPRVMRGILWCLGYR